MSAANPEKKSDAGNKKPAGGGLNLGQMLPVTSLGKAFKKAKGMPLPKPAVGKDKGKLTEKDSAIKNTK